MKREDIEKLFEGKLADGVEVKGLIDAILATNGSDITAAKTSAQRVAADEIERAKTEAIKTAVEEALKPYKEGGELYINRDEFKRASEELKAYRERDIKIARDNAIQELLKNANFDSKVTKLLQKAIVDYEPKFTEDNKIENGEAVIEKMKTDYKDFVITESEGGFRMPSNNQSGGDNVDNEALDKAAMDAYFKKK